MENNLTLTPPHCLLEVNQIHRELEDLFTRHQMALLRADYGAARNLLEAYEEGLFTHMKEEEEILVPLYQSRTAHLRGGDAEIFTLEHKKIVEWLNRLKMRLHRIVPSVPDLKAVIALLDDESQFKKFIEHHSLREDRIFYPEIEKVVDEKEKTHLLRLLTFNLGEKAPIDP